jgi:FkbM family methyltransferase
VRDDAPLDGRSFNLPLVIVSRLRSVVREGLHRAGWDLRGWPNPDDPAHRRQMLLEAKRVDLVVDVGANVGQYGRELRAYGYRGAIVSLEPTQSAFAELAALASGDTLWTVLRTAAGAEAGSITINVSANSVSSSALPMLDRHAQVAPESRFTGTETAAVDRLDNLVATAVTNARNPFLKIDVQGFERAVLEGAAAILPSFAAVELELSFVALYEGQALWRDHIDFMEAAGFTLVGLTPVFWDEVSGEMLQADGIFARTH